MGNKVKGDILMVMPCAFHLGWRGSTRRLFNIAEAFVKLGFRVILLAGKATNPHQAEIDNQFPGLVIRTHHAGAYPRIVDVAPKLRRAWRVLWKIRGAECYWAQLSYGWGQKLDVEWVLNELALHDFNPELVWGVAAGYLEGAVGAERIARAMKVPYILELHDPPWGAGLDTDRGSVQRKFGELLSSASAIVVNAASYMDKLVCHFGVPEGRVHTIHFTYQDAPATVQSAENDCFVLVYAGSLAGGRSLVPVLDAIEQAIASTPAFTCQVVLVGSRLEFDGTKRTADAKKLLHLIDLRGEVSATAVQALLANANLLIIVQPNQNYWQIPGKIFESIYTRNPILGIMPNDCETAQILRRSGLGIIHENTDIEGMRNAIIELWQAWMGGRSIVVPDEGYISQFSVERLPEKIRPIFHSAGIIKEFGEGENGHGS